MIEMELLRDQTDDHVTSARIVVTGECRISMVGELHRTVKNALASAEDILLDLEGVTGTDTSFYQLLCSLHRSAVLQDKHVAVKGGENESVLEGRRRSGFTSPRGCSISGSNGCLCHGGEQ